MSTFKLFCDPWVVFPLLELIVGGRVRVRKVQAHHVACHIGEFNTENLTHGKFNTENLTHGEFNTENLTHGEFNTENLNAEN